MNTTLKIELMPFPVPNFVEAKGLPQVRGDGFKEATRYPLCTLEPETLAELCEHFTSQVFANAGKTRPPQEK